MIRAEAGSFVGGNIAEVAEGYLILRLDESCPHDTVTIDIEPGSEAWAELGRRVLVHVNEAAEDEMQMAVRIMD